MRQQQRAEENANRIIRKKKWERTDGWLNGLLLFLFPGRKKRMEDGNYELIFMIMTF